jgi:membrane protein
MSLDRDRPDSTSASAPNGARDRFSGSATDSGIDRVIRPIDRLQQRHTWMAFPLAVVKKCSDDSAGNLAALIAYYAFVAIFPLLLLFTTILGYVLQSHESLRERLLRSAIVDFPVIGDQLRSAGGLQGHWYVVVLSVVISLWGARGVANACQTAFNTVWNVPFSQRPGFPTAIVRSFALLGVAGIAVLCTGTLSGIGSTASVLGATTRVLALIVSVAITIGVFLLGFRLATARAVPLRRMARSAVASALVWQLLLVAGSFLLEHQVRHAQALYGTFGLILGLLAWLHLQAQLTLYAVEADAARSSGQLTSTLCSSSGLRRVVWAYAR